MPGEFESGVPEEYKNWKAPDTSPDTASEEVAKNAEDEAQRQNLLRLAETGGTTEYYRQNLDTRNEEAVRRFAAAEVQRQQAGDKSGEVHPQHKLERQRLQSLAHGDTGPGVDEARATLLREVGLQEGTGRADASISETSLAETRFGEQPLRKDSPSSWQVETSKLRGFQGAAMEEGRIDIALKTLLTRSRLREIQRSKSDGEETVQLIDIEAHPLIISQYQTAAGAVVKRLGMNKSERDLGMEIGELKVMLERGQQLEGGQARDYRSSGTAERIQQAIGEREQALEIAGKRR